MGLFDTGVFSTPGADPTKLLLDIMYRAERTFEAHHVVECKCGKKFNVLLEGKVSVVTEIGE